MSVETTQLGSYLENFTEFAKVTVRETPPWLRELREFAFARFCSAGFPTTRHEDWRFTNVAALARMPFQLARKTAVQLTVSDLKRWRMQGAVARLVFVDGHFAPGLSDARRAARWRHGEQPSGRDNEWFAGDSRSSGALSRYRARPVLRSQYCLCR